MSGRAWGLLLIGLLGIAVGAILRWAEVLAVGAAVLVLLAAPLALRRPKKAAWHDVESPTRVTREDDAAVTIDVIIPTGSTRWVSAVSDGLGPRHFLDHSPADGQQQLTWPIDTSRRGLFLVGPSRLETSDPFGVSTRVLATREPSPTLVVPRVRPVDTGVIRRSGEEGPSGERTGAETFQSLREYVVGDPMRSIHWRSSARAGTLMVKRMVDTTVPWLLVVLDVSIRSYDRTGSMFADFDSAAFEETVDTAASWAWHGCTPQQRVLLTTTSVASSEATLAAEVTVRTRESALDALAIVHPLAETDCGSSRVAALSRRQGVGRIVLVTGAHAREAEHWARSWRARMPVDVIVGHS